MTEGDAAQREVPLPGGHTAQLVVRVGDTVRRSPTPNSNFVAQLLTHLEQAGTRVAPRYLGRDPQNRDILQFLPGRTTDHPSQRDEGAYAAGGRLLRRLHDATAGHPLAGAEECVIHGDPGPYNTIFQDGLPTTLIDWDSARPGRRSWDLGYAGWTWCIQSQGNVPLQDQAHRLRALRDGYGSTATRALIVQIEDCQMHIAGTARRQLARPGKPAHEYDHHRRAAAWAEADRHLVRTHRTVFLDALTDPLGEPNL